MNLDAALTHAAAALNPLPASSPPDLVVAIRADALRTLCRYAKDHNGQIPTLSDTATGLWAESPPAAWEAA